ncbi:MAG: amylo-alpha-1,6-glucosidase [Pyrinomonadaceae bacterium]
MITFDAENCRQFDFSTCREWLETNGLGGFASATVCGMNARRYHGLLVAATRPPTERAVLLSKLEETIVLADGARYDLGTNRYPNETIHPQGYLLQTGFRLDPFPVFTYRAGPVKLEKTVFMRHGENTTVVRYRLLDESGAGAVLELRPLVSFRNYHWLNRESYDAFEPIAVEDGVLRIARRDRTGGALYLAHDARQVNQEAHWYRNFELPEEQSRGFDFKEDLYNPCTLVFDLKGDQTCAVVASTEPRDAGRAAAFEEQEKSRRLQIAAASPRPDDDYVRQLALAADQFIVSRGRTLHSVIAGYPWFTDWGRDTMISLPGVALALKKYGTAREILLAFAAHIRGGLIPNRFPDADEEPEYNTVDGTLWYVNAVGAYLRHTGDEQFVREYFFELLKEIVASHERGTLYGIRACEDGLLRAGHEGVQLTWMDAKVDDYVVTPRTGKPVEIQALWYNALRTVEELARRFKDDACADRCGRLADRARESFDTLFWNQGDQCLYDYVDDAGEPNADLRPNQIFAVSLPHPILEGERARQVVLTVERELLTPYGLRSLSPRHPAYRARYEGGPYQRDTAYHQGTVWGWLIGPFITAYLKIHLRSPASLKMARLWTTEFRTHLTEAGLGQVSEIFDADPPHTPRGCFAQAWSVAELLRCELEELV